MFKSDPFKSDLPARGEANGTATGISNGKSRVSDEVNLGCITFALICFLIIVLAHFSFFHTQLTYDWLKNHVLLSRPIRSETKTTCDILTHAHVPPGLRACLLYLSRVLIGLFDCLLVL